MKFGFFCARLGPLFLLSACGTSYDLTAFQLPEKRGTPGFTDPIPASPAPISGGVGGGAETITEVVPSPAYLPPDSSVGEVVCDPFEKGNVVDPVLGLKGELWSLSDVALASQVSRSSDIAKHGHLETENLFLSRLHVPTRSFSEGFANGSGETLKNESGATLFEWFSMTLETSIVLAGQDEPGQYQFAVISDDGATVTVEDKSGHEYELINNEGTHPTKLGCSTMTIELTNSVSLPLRVSYFQGPRYHISLSLVWRKVPNGYPAVKDELCNDSSNDFYATPARGKSSFDQLLARGWKVLEPENYMLRTGYNKCSQIPMPGSGG